MRFELKHLSFQLFLLAFCLLPDISGAVVGQQDTTRFDHTHALWGEVLSKYVKRDRYSTAVQYRELSKDSQTLDRYLHTLSKVKLHEYEQFSEEQKLAFLINAYNAFTVKLILDNYPVTSIKKLGGWFSSPWKKKFFRLLGKEYSLDEIEHGTIRRHFKEPRIHFAVNCASIGCPALREEPYRAEKLNDQLEAASYKTKREITSIIASILSFSHQFLNGTARILFRPKAPCKRLSLHI